MKFKHLFLYCSVLLLVACATRTVEVLPVTPEGDNATVKLAETAQSINTSLIELAKIQATATPEKRDPTLGIPDSFALQNYISIDWSGPVETIVRQIAKATNYHTRIIGKRPAIPVLVAVNKNNTPIVDILRNVAYQTYPRATIHVSSKNRVIELRYANT